MGWPIEMGIGMTVGGANGKFNDEGIKVGLPRLLDAVIRLGVAIETVEAVDGGVGAGDRTIRGIRALFEACLGTGNVCVGWTGGTV